MATIKASLSHEERTSQEPRENRLEDVTLSRIESVNQTIRLLRLSSTDPKHAFRFLPGQWLDVFIPGLSKAGGFTVTSTPREGQPTSERPAYFELAIQKSENPPAKWLWRPEDDILHKQLVVRVGGSFTWPPLDVDYTGIESVLLVAGGVGINPLVSIFSHLLQQSHPPRTLEFIYSTKIEGGRIDGSHILFLKRVMGLLKEASNYKTNLELFLTGASKDEISKATGLPSDVHLGRITPSDLDNALGHDIQRRTKTLAYVCGPPRMTDEIVSYLASREGMTGERVLCEKWW
ncbi:hypothetical protein AAFC00_001368 [Neodothiora populina]|uniref:Oxidoreductase NAD-binding domain-containing protein 1 n=1 Tax=Neodothiora populina TaxID=2781224 RepID=A0ABR3PPR4_9PEZI